MRAREVFIACLFSDENRSSTQGLGDLPVAARQFPPLPVRLRCIALQSQSHSHSHSHCSDVYVYVYIYVCVRVCVCCFEFLVFCWGGFWISRRWFRVRADCDRLKKIGTYMGGWRWLGSVSPSFTCLGSEGFWLGWVWYDLTEYLPAWRRRGRYILCISGFWSIGLFGC